MLVSSIGTVGDMWAQGRLLIAGTVDRSTLPSGWVRLDHPAAGFSVAYPKDWHAIGADAPWGATTLSNYDTTSVPAGITPDDERFFKLDVAVHPNPKNLPIDAWVTQNEALAAAAPIHSAGAPRTVKNITLDLAGKATIQREYENGMHVFYVAASGRVYIVSFSAKASFTGTAQAITQSIRITK